MIIWGIGRNIKAARERKNLTQKQLAELIGVTSSAITNYENETSHPKEPVLFNLMQVLEVDANFLFSEYFLSKNTVALTLHESEHIKKYRALEERDREALDAMLDHMYNRAVDAAAAKKGVG